MTETTLTLYGKQHKTRTIEVSPRLAESIEARRERLKKKPGDLLFVNQIWTGINSARMGRLHRATEPPTPPTPRRIRQVKEGNQKMPGPIATIKLGGNLET